MSESIIQLDSYIERCRNADTKEILKSCSRGYYVNDQNKDVQISDQIHNCLINTKSYPPDFIFELPPLEKKEKGTIEIRNETTIRGALRMVVEEKKENVCALNFANANHPGGGVLFHAKAQEESICRSSALFYSLIQKNDFYEYHHELDSNVASNYLIFTPDCPTWKVDNDTLDNPFLVSFVTSAAVHNYDVQTREEIRQIHHERIKAILYCSICNGVKNIILGAFGCGAFRNSPEDIAQSFKYWLVDQNLKDYFESISFSIIERKDSRINSQLRNIDVFADAFDLPIIETSQFDKREFEQKERKQKEQEQLERKMKEREQSVLRQNEAKQKERKMHKQIAKKHQTLYSDTDYSYEEDDNEYYDLCNDYWNYYYYNYYYSYYYWYYNSRF